ncbi:ChaB family protein, partial [Thiohalophilus sp.]
DREDREATAHKVAWSAVKKRYRKSGEKWVEK